MEENNRLENYGEDKVNNYWARSAKIADEVRWWRTKEFSAAEMTGALSPLDIKT